MTTTRVFKSGNSQAVRLPKVVTNNEREFRRVPGLKVQNWVGC
jgi:virulence-associated protein VagC